MNSRSPFVEKFSDPTTRYRLKLGIFFFSLVVALLCFEEVADDVFDDVPAGDLDAQRFDQNVAGWFAAVRNPALTRAMIDLTALGSVSVLLAGSVVILGVLAFSRNLFRAFHFMLVGMGAVLIPVMLKIQFDRARPDLFDHLVQVSDLSFPSGHAFGATSIYLFVAIWAWTWNVRAIASAAASLFAIFLILLVGVSRIYLGVHYPTDVMAGIAAGAAWTLLVAIAFLVLDRWRR